MLNERKRLFPLLIFICWEKKLDLLLGLQTISIFRKDVINLAQLISDKFLDVPKRINPYDTELTEKIMQD